MEDTVRLRLLGTVQVERDGEPVRGFESRKALALLGYLATQGKPIPREHLVDLLWGDKSETRGRANLSWVLNRISTLLPGCLQADRHNVQFQQTAPYWLDIVAFEELEAQGKASSLAAAMELYRGEFLEGLYLRGCAEFEIWLVGERERWRQRVTWVLGELITHHGQRGEHKQGLRFARRLLALEPWREETHRQVMRLLAYSGQRGAALAQYEACRRALAKELGVEPMPETTALYERIQAAASARRHNLPAQPTPFVGRKEELAEIVRLLDDPSCRLLTILGPGGIGKTRLALKAGEAKTEAFLEGVYFVPLAAVSSAEFLVSALADALRFSFSGPADPQVQLLNYLRGKEMLLILDNFEHLIPPTLVLSQAEGREGERGGAGWLGEILEKAPEVKLLVTSRERLNLQGEWLLKVEGLSFPADEKAERGEEYSAVALFAQSASRIRRGFTCTERERPGVMTICQLVQGMPLGIILAAAWVDMLTPAEIAEEISHSLDFLKTDLRDRPKRQRSMRAVLDYSWRLLTQQEREVFQGLSVFRGGFTRRAAQQVTDASLRELRALVNKSLLHHVPTPSTELIPSRVEELRTGGRYEVHGLSRQYAAEKLAESPAIRRAVHDRHSAYYAAALQRWWADLKGPRQQTALAEIEPDSENARAAWNWAVEHGQVERLEQALEGLCRFYEWRGRCQEGEIACRLAAHKLAATLSGSGRRVWAVTLAWQSAFGRLLGRTELASQLLEQSLALLEMPGLDDQDTRPEKAFVLLQMGHIAVDSSRAEARQLYEQSLALYQALGDRWETANTLHALSWVAENSGNYGEAKRLGKESLAIRQALGDQRGMTYSLMRLGLTALSQGQVEEAQRLVQESIAIRQEIGDRFGLASGLFNLGITLLSLGKFADAHSLQEESGAISNDLGFREGIASSRIAQSLAKTQLGQYEQARAQGQASLALSREIGYRGGVGDSLFVLGSVALAEEAYAKAHQLLRKSIAVYRETGQQDELSRALAVLGCAARGLGQLPQARQYLCEALRTATEIRAFWPLVLALSAIALLLADQGENERAVELYALASRYPLVANSRLFEDIAGRHIAAVAATLPPDVIVAAQARGQARDLTATVAELLVALGK